MGLLVNGQWQDAWYDTDSTGGRFKREESGFREWITADGSSGFKAEPGRYHLYVAYSCPWAHRALIWRSLKGLQDAISVSFVAYAMGDQGWYFNPADGSTGDPILGSEYLHQVYTAARTDFTGRVTVPVLWDKKTGTIVNNESSEIIRMLNSAFDGCGASGPDLYPQPLRAEIDAINQVIYDNVNNGVYKCGFATTQKAYEEAFDTLFATLDTLEQHLNDHRYLVGDTLTEADWRLYPTLLRFDLAYHGNFKCNARMLKDYPNLWGYCRELYQHPGIAGTSNLENIKRGYYLIRRVNPTGIIPKGPFIDFSAPHDRDRLPAAT